MKFLELKNAANKLNDGLLRKHEFVRGTAVDLLEYLYSARVGIPEKTVGVRNLEHAGDSDAWVNPDNLSLSYGDLAVGFAIDLELQMPETYLGAVRVTTGVTFKFDSQGFVAAQVSRDEVRTHLSGATEDNFIQDLGEMILSRWKSKIEAIEP